jgi:hypothetical protein
MTCILEAQYKIIRLKLRGLTCLIKWIRLKLTYLVLLPMLQHDLDPTREYELPPLLGTIPHFHLSIFNGLILCHDLILCQVRVSIYNFIPISRHNMTETEITAPYNRE